MTPAGLVFNDIQGKGSVITHFHACVTGCGSRLGEHCIVAGAAGSTAPLLVLGLLPRVWCRRLNFPPVYECASEGRRALRGIGGLCRVRVPASRPVHAGIRLRRYPLP